MERSGDTMTMPLEVLKDRPEETRDREEEEEEEEAFIERGGGTLADDTGV